MFKKLKILKIFVITILVSMVFAVNIGFTFAGVNASKVDYTLEVNSDTESTDDRRTYLNDVVVNNSTINIPIAYTLGTVQREINFDYSFSESVDVAVTYEMYYAKYDANTNKYVKDESEEKVSNVLLNVVNRDKYIWDQEFVSLANYTPAFNISSDSGTLYYLDSITGTGNMKLFSGVTFLTGNNRVNSYISSSAITVGIKTYNAESKLSSVEHQYTQLEVSRFWEENEVDTLGRATSYICRTGYSIIANGNTTTVSSGTTKTASEYKSYIESAVSGYWTKGYKCLSEFTVDAKTYTVGTVYSVDDYSTAVAADSDYANNFEICYTASTPYQISANEVIIESLGSNEIAKDTVISAEEYALLLPSEQAYFAVNEYKTFENKNLVISVNVHTCVKCEDPSEYTADHYFKEFKIKEPNTTMAFSNWIKYKSGNITENIAMIYNGHAKFENAIPYAIDFAGSENMSTTLASSKTNLTSTYIYKKEGELSYFYSYAGGNKYNAGIGVYYLTSSTATKLSVQVSATWYNSNGDAISAMPINNINLVYNGGNEYSFSKVLAANSYGYVDVLDYIQTITEGDLFDMNGYSLVISSATATFQSVSETADSTDALQITNSTSYNPILYTYNRHQGVTSSLDFNITITNNSNTPISIPTVTLDPVFVAYNGSTSISSDSNVGYGVANSVNGEDIAGFTYVYDSSVWSVAGNVFTSTGGYIAPYTSLIVASGVTVPGGLDWSFNLNGSQDKYYADYWFEVGASYEENNATVQYLENTNYSSAEVMTSLTHTKENTQNGVVSYIAIRNNTLQTITAITYNGTLLLGNNSTSSITYYINDSTTAESSNAFEISVSGLELFPGESIYICKLTIPSNQSAGDNYVGLSSSSAIVTLAENATAARTGNYFKRDFASGNLTVINGNASGIEENGLKITGLTDLIGGSEKWNSSNQFIMQDTNSSLAKFRNGQMIHLLSNITSNLSGYGCSSVAIS